MPDKEKGIECYADTEFTGAWDKAGVDNPDFLNLELGL